MPQLPPTQRRDARAPTLDGRLLAVFDGLSQTASVTQTALQLGLTQPQVSVALARLRQIWADPLFVRTPRGMSPTPRAQALAADVGLALAALKRLSAPVQPFDPALAQRTFVVAMTDASHITMLPQLLAALRAAGSQLTLRACRAEADLAQAMADGPVDLALGYLPGLETGFYRQKLYSQAWVCLAAAEHPHLRGLALTDWGEAVYLAQAHVGMPVGSSYRLLDAQLAQRGVQRRIVLELPGYLGLPAILRNSDLLATLPQQIGSTLAADTGLRLWPCPWPISGFDVHQYWHARWHQDAAHRWLRAKVATLFGRAPDAVA